ncbi:MAG: hypothetical protein R3F39_17535 [Myxococcota bacterium]
MNRCCEAGYDTQEDKRSEQPRVFAHPFGADDATPADAGAGTRRLYAVGSPRPEHPGFTRAR